MAGDWIKFELSTLDKPEVIRLSRQLGMSKEAVCGWLIRFWGWYSANSADGNVANVSPEDIDVVLSLPGFAEAIKSVGWLKEGKNKSLTVPNFDYHMSESAKKRALKTRQKQIERSRVDGDTLATNERPEKRREEKRVERSNRASRLPPTWRPAEPLTSWASKERPDLDLESTIAKFRDYWVAKPGAAGTKLDWDATFRNWVRGEKAGNAPVKVKVDL